MLYRKLSERYRKCLSTCPFHHVYFGGKKKQTTFAKSKKKTAKYSFLLNQKLRGATWYVA